MNITDTYPITYSKSPQTDAIDANKIIRTATAEELSEYKITKNFDRYEGPSFNDGEIALGQRTPLKLEPLEISDDMDVKGAVGSLFSQIGLYDHHVPFDSSLDRLHPDAYWAGFSLKQQVEKSGFNEDNIADIAAKVGSEIDRYYREGKISDELYGRFNDEIKSAVKSFIDELTTVRVTVAEEREAAQGYALYGYSYKFMRPRSFEEYLLHRLELKKKILEENPLDFNDFFGKINQMRFNVTGIESNSDESGSANKS